MSHDANELTPLSVVAGGDLELSNGDDAGGAGAEEEVEWGMWKYWVLLILAILLEVAGTTAMKLSDGLTKLIPSVSIYVLYGVSFVLFPLSLKGIQLSTAYAIWSGLGTTVTCIIGFVAFHDSINWIKVGALIAITGGCVVLKFADDIDEEMEGK